MTKNNNSSLMVRVKYVKSWIREAPIFVRLLGIIVAVAGGVILMGLYQLAEVRPHEITVYEARTKNQADAAKTVVQTFYDKEKSGEMTHALAQKNALDVLRNMRYQGSNYFWVNDMNTVMVMHPIQTNLDGQSMATYKDPNGKTIFVDFVNTVKKDGQGYVDYSWPKPGAKTSSPKISYVTGFAPWNWVIGTGVYVDSIDASIAEQRKEIITHSAILLAFVTSVTSLVSLSITRPVKRLTTAMKHSKSGHQMRISLKGQPKEISELAKAIRDARTAEIIREQKRNEFFDIASHELRTPLTAIRGNSSMVQEMYGDKKLREPEPSEMLSDIHDSSVRLISVVNDFLDTSKLENNKLIYSIQPVDITQLLKDIVAEYKPFYASHGLHLDLSLPQEEIGKVSADHNRLKQVIINLLGNAIKFTDVGGVDVKLQQADNQICIDVSDSGSGIAEEYQKLIFKKFRQAHEDNLTRDSSQSSGLGLYISRLIIKQMGGQLELLSSKPGEGSTFRIALPLDKN